METTRQHERLTYPDQSLMGVELGEDVLLRPAENLVNTLGIFA